LATDPQGNPDEVSRQTGRRRRPRARPLAVVAATASIMLAACSSSTPSSSPPPTTFTPGALPTTISSVAQQATAQFCAHLADVRTQLAEFQANSTPDMSAATAKLAALSSQLRIDAQQLQTQGQAQAATLAQQAAGAVDAVRAIISRNQGSIPPALQAALSSLNTILTKVPGPLCPSPGTTTSP
jgi:hypothetical protein